MILRATVFVLSIAFYLVSYSDLIPIDYSSTLYRVYRWLGVCLLIGSTLTPKRNVITAKSIIEVFSIFIAAKVLAKTFTFFLNANLIVLFKATTFTASLAWGVASLTPLLLFALVPVIQRVSWYYVVAYCALCGGTVLASVFGFTVVLGLAWTHLVKSPWTDSIC